MGKGAKEDGKGIINEVYSLNGTVLAKIFRPNFKTYVFQLHIKSPSRRFNIKRLINPMWCIFVSQMKMKQLRMRFIQ